MSAARIRLSASCSGTCSVSPTALTLAVMMPTASSIDIKGPPKAKQSSESWAMNPRQQSSSAPGQRQHVGDRHRGLLDQRRDGRDIVEMDLRQGRFNVDIAGYPDDAGIIGKQQRLAVAGAMHLDLV